MQISYSSATEQDSPFALASSFNHTKGLNFPSLDCTEIACNGNKKILT